MRLSVLLICTVLSLFLYRCKTSDAQPEVIDELVSQEDPPLRVAASLPKELELIVPPPPTVIASETFPKLDAQEVKESSFKVTEEKFYSVSLDGFQFSIEWPLDNGERAKVWQVLQDAGACIVTLPFESPENPLVEKSYSCLHGHLSGIVRVPGVGVQRLITHSMLAGSLLAESGRAELGYMMPARWERAKIYALPRQKSNSETSQYKARYIVEHKQVKIQVFWANGSPIEPITLMVE